MHIFSDIECVGAFMPMCHVEIGTVFQLDNVCEFVDTDLHFKLTKVLTITV